MKKISIILLSAFILNTATAQTPTILKDIYSFENQSSIGISNFQYVTSGSNVYFAAFDVLNGNELWKTNGTPSGTSLVKDIIEGSGNSNPEKLTDVNGVLFFRATTAANGVELWKSDGTPEGTKLVKDIYEGANSSYPDNLTNVNGVLYFIATTPSTGYELWKSDGTPEGTVMVKDIYAGSGGSNPMNLVNVNGTLFFSAAGSGSTSNYELWKSNAEGTILVKEIREGNASSTPGNFTNFNGSLFFSANNGIHGLELWKSDGTVDGTFMFKDINTTGIGSNSGAPTNFYVFKNNLYFSALDGVNGFELWKSNGTPEGTAMLKDLDPGVGWSSSPKMFTAVGSTLYFVASGRTTGPEVWKTDGTAENTNIVADLIPGQITSDPQDLINYNGTLYFYTNSYSFTHLWKSDGTAEGTIMIKDDVLGGGTIRSLFAGPNKMHFVYKGFKEGIPSTATGDEPWISDGTDGGTDILKDINTSNAGSNPQKFCKVGNITFFTANDGLHGTELWKTDGTNEGTILVKDITEGNQNGAIDNLTAVNSTLYFTATVAGVGNELWKSGGTPEGTIMLKDIFEGTRSSSPQNLKDVNGTLYFSADTYVEGREKGREIWKSDGTPETTILVKDIMPGATSSNPNKFIYVDGIIFFTAQNGARSGYVDEELWRTDGTDGGTSRVKDIYTGISGSTPDYLTNFKNTLYFSASGETGTQLWTSDGTESGTAIFQGFSGGKYLYPQNLTVIGNNLYYGGKTQEGGVGLWKTNGTAGGTIRVKQTSASGTYPANFTLSNGQIFFTAYADGAGKELWKTNGSEAGTQLLKDLLPGSSSSNVELLTDFKGTLYFKASPETAGISELWRSDGTADGTIIVELNPANKPAYGSNPSGLIVMNDILLFGATDFFKGAELWRIVNSAAPVTLMRFTAAKDNKKVTLNWQTTNEVNTSVFEIERAGKSDFIKIGSVTAMNKSGLHNYKMVDEQPLKGTNFYRLKMIDIDGAFSYSNIERVDFFTAQQVHISPNPAANELKINNVNGYDLVQVLDASGRIVLQQKIYGDRFVGNIQKLTPGTYMVRLTGKNEKKSLQFVKQ